MHRQFWQNLQDKLQQKLANKFIRNLGWLGLSEIIIRISRLVTTFVLARFLTSYDYGLAAIVMTTQELSQVFTRSGISSKLIQADAEGFEELCNDAYWLNWLIYFGLFVTQGLLAFPIAWFYQDSHLILPICTLGLIYLVNPIGKINSFLIMRENRLEIRALAHTVSICTSNFLSLILAYFGFGIWAIVIPIVCVAPLTTYIYYSSHPWRPPNKITTKRWGEIFSFGKSIVGVELLYTLRNNLDYLLIGRLISIEELGIYYFAFNAGLGISLSVINAIKAAILPHLCSLRSDGRELKQQYIKSLKTIALIIVPMVLLQSSLAPFYVPIVFGEKWRIAIPLLMLICLSAIPRPFADAASQLLVAIGQPEWDFRWNICFTLIFIASLFVGVYWHSFGVALTVLLVHFVCLPLFTLWASRYVFQRTKNTNAN